MTVLEMLRGVRPSADADDAGGAPSQAPSWLPLPVRDVLVGVATGVLSLLVVVVPTLLGWLLDPRPGGSLAEPLGAGSSLWLLVQGAHLGADATRVAFVPLALGALAVWLASRGAGRALETADADDEFFAELLPRSVTATAARWWLGYAVALGLASALTLVGSLPLRWLSLPVPVVVVPLVALVLAVRRLSREADVLGPRFDVLVPPETARRAGGAAARGLALLLGLATATVLGAVVVRWDAVSGLQAEVGAGFLGSLLLVAAQAAALPNLALWVVALLAGPGFSVVDGAHTSLAGSASGLMPLVPVLGAMPEPGPWPWFTRLLVVVPVLVGAYIGRRSLAAVARLSSLRTKASVAAFACVLVAAAVGLLDGIGGGSLGAYRLSDIGAHALGTSLAVGGELLLGALGVVAWDAWRLRR
ncbi:cell division protein PerM [Knoellia sp. LjRoot47]|uniref:cell division protein PerM n=1 Tax=Knoellia sp. LjRoot47 TaxID=3342330 RepID=UPI003ECD302A